MVSSISGLPAIVIEGLNRLETELANQENKPNLQDEGSLNVVKKQIQDEQKLSNTNFNELNVKLNNIIGDDNLAFEFSKDEITDKMIIKLIDSKTNEVVKQLPPEVTLMIARLVANTMATENGNITNVTI